MSFKLYTKRDVIDDLAKELGCTKKEAKNIIACVDRINIAKLVEGYAVVVNGLGTLQIKEVKETRRFIPTKGELVSIPAHKKLKFKQRIVLT